MLMPPERIEYYNNSLRQQLQRLVVSVKSYHELRGSKTAELTNKANRLWELNQRYRLVKGKNEAASVYLLSACQEAFQGLYNSILHLDEELFEVFIQVEEFKNECMQLTTEQETSETPGFLKELLDFLEESLKSMQNQTKYLELHLRQLHPKFALGESALEAFKSDLQLPEHIEASMTLGLAKIERLLKKPLDFVQEKLIRVDGPQTIVGA
ncbi:uncharacterized protein [Drosophila kikkawai]|uniref:Uncharacterized protein n=1 Tax=Drosophila kikkawai TaxID=30033 RepID=A0A6P4JTK6_DROKI|nr:uncharacterized protein LOC108085780 [Drosophila kikkawai]